MTTELTEAPEQDAPEQSFLDTIKALNTDRLFVHIELDRLKIDPRYQRKVNAQRVRKYAAEYNEDLMGVLLCSVRPDGIFVIDGQHRLEIARLLGHPTVRCELRIGLDLEREAYLFHSLDTARVALNSDDAFRALLVSQDPAAIRIKQAVEDAGLVIADSPRQNGVRAFKTLLALEKQYGIGVIRDTLKVLHDAWPNTVNQAPAGVLEGMVYFLKAYPEVKLKELARVLHGTTAETLMVTARSITGSLAWNTRKSMAQSILTIYNKRRQSGRLDDRLS